MLKMKTLIFNGSPRGEYSNSNVINTWLRESIGVEDKDLIIRDRKSHDSYLKRMEDGDIFIITFPLYADSMPGIVMNFFEKVYNYRDNLRGKKYVFVVHCGFPESAHMHGIRDYLNVFVDKMNGQLVGVVLKGGSEGFRLMPEKSLTKTRKSFTEIGISIKEGKEIPRLHLDKLEKPIHLNKLTQVLFKIFSALKLANLYWDSNLKRNKAFEKRFDRPYTEL